MRIGIFTDSYLPTPTGVAVSVETFRKELERRGHEVYIFAPEFPGYKDHNPRVYRFVSFFYPSRPDAPICWPIPIPPYRKIADLNLDIIHTQHFFTMGSLGLKVGKKLQIPVVHTYHTYYEKYVATYAPMFLKNIAKSYALWKSRAYCNACDQIISPSPSMKKVLKSYNIKTSIEPIPTGIDIGAFRAMPPDELRGKYGIPADRKILLFVGRLGEEKNIKFLLQAFERIHKRRPDTHLLLIGGGPSEEEYHQIVERSEYRDNITFTGFLKKGETNRIFGACDIFITACATDTQGIVIVEAMAAGIPTVAIDELGPSDIIRDNEDGYLVPLNLSAFTDKILYLLEHDKIRMHFGQAARHNARRFSTENCTDHLLAIYQRLVKEETPAIETEGLAKIYEE